MQGSCFFSFVCDRMWVQALFRRFFPGLIRFVVGMFCYYTEVPCCSAHLVSLAETGSGQGLTNSIERMEFNYQGWVTLRLGRRKVGHRL